MSICSVGIVSCRDVVPGVLYASKFRVDQRAHLGVAGFALYSYYENRLTHRDDLLGRKRHYH